jgi:hypothetical protein
LRNITEQKSSANTSTSKSKTMECGGHSFTLSEPARARTSHIAEGTLFVPFWWVKSSDDDQLVNMAARERSHKGASFTVLMNTRKIEKFEPLVLRRAAKVFMEPLQKAIKLESDAPASVPTKRQRR